MIGCNLGETSRTQKYNTVTPGGIKVRMPNVAWDENFESLLMYEIDYAGVPRNYVVVLHSTFVIPYPDSSKYPNGVHGYTSFNLKEIHCGVRTDLSPFIPVLPHEVQHAQCECWCISDGSHDNDPQCK